MFLGLHALCIRNDMLTERSRMFCKLYIGSVKSDETSDVSLQARRMPGPSVVRRDYLWPATNGPTDQLRLRTIYCVTVHLLTCAESAGSGRDIDEKWATEYRPRSLHLDAILKAQM